MTHAQSHNGHGPSGDLHGHAPTDAASQAILWVAAVFVGFGLLEVVVAMFVGPAATTVFADGVHNLVDALVLLVVALSEELLGRNPHPWSLFGRKILNVALGAIGSLAYGASFMGWSHDRGLAPGLSAREAVIMLGFGGASYWINQRCHGHTRHHHRGLSAHLLGDMVSAIAIVATTVAISLALPISGALTTFIAITAFNIMVYVSWKELAPSIKALPDDFRQLRAALEPMPPAEPEPVPSQIRPATMHTVPSRHNPELEASSPHNAMHVSQALDGLMTAIREWASSYERPDGVPIMTAQPRGG